MTDETPLHDGWTVRAVGGPIPRPVAGVRVPATVPGCVHLDLLAAGLIPDPYLDENEQVVSWIGHVDWRYETQFDHAGSAAGERTDLVAYGLDTIATIELNGGVVARTANMHRTHRVDVTDLLRAGTNELAVTFAAPVEAAERASAEIGPRPHVNAHPYNALRKMASNYGWDWGPDLPTSGIWAPLVLQSRHTARLAGVRPLITLDGSTAVVDVHVDIDRTSAVELTVAADVAGVRGSTTLAPDASTCAVRVQVPDAELWWPRGFGTQALYELTVELSTGAAELDRAQRRVGFRTVEVVDEPDEYGTRFAVRVNGVELFVRGVNWIPDDCFPSRISRERYRDRLTQAADANVNLVRVWGGGLYESEDFYDACDELGLLVWQDFLFACAAYSEEEPLRGEVIAEAREAVTRLSSHPSLTVWNGGNENLWGHEDWDWKRPLAGRSWGAGYYYDLLPAIVAELDPTRPYLPGSPSSMSAPDAHPNDPAHGTMHIWDVWNSLDYTAYRDRIPRFVSEFGFQGPPAWATLARSVHDDPLEPDSPGMLAHQKAEDGQQKLVRGLKPHLPVPEAIDDWHWATSLNQARALAYGIEHLRSWSPICRGAIVWQLNDCWPVTSWSAVDGDGRRKPLWYALRRSFRDRLVTVQPRAAGLAVVAVNDSAQHWHERVVVERRRFDGAALAETSVDLDCAPGTAVTVLLPDSVAVPDDPRSEVIAVRGEHTSAFWFHTEDVDAALPVPESKSAVQRVADGYRVSVHAESLLKDVAVLADRVAPDAVVDDMLRTILPGESATFTIRTNADVAPDRFLDPLVLRCANQLVHPGP